MVGRDLIGSRFPIPDSQVNGHAADAADAGVLAEDSAAGDSDDRPTSSPWSPSSQGGEKVVIVSQQQTGERERERLLGALELATLLDKPADAPFQHPDLLVAVLVELIVSATAYSIFISILSRCQHTVTVHLHRAIRQSATSTVPRGLQFAT